MNCGLAAARTSTISSLGVVISDYETFPLFNVLLTLSKH